MASNYRNRIRYGQPLSPAEYRIVRAMVEVGGNVRNLAFELRLDPSTVRSHQYHAAIKLGTAGLSSTASATVAEAFRRGILREVRSLQEPTTEYRMQRMIDPYVVRHLDGTRDLKQPWARPISMRGPR